MTALIEVGKTQDIARNISDCGSWGWTRQYKNPTAAVKCICHNKKLGCSAA